jgi:hypothetical protein
MAKIITDKEMVEIIEKVIADENVFGDQNIYKRFLYDLAELITNYCGGDHGEPDYDAADELGYIVPFRIDDRIPEDGGVFKDYDTDVTWKDGKEDQV